MEIRNVKITGINSEGFGVGRSEEFAKVLFVKSAIIGEVVNVKIAKEEKNFALADVLEILEKSPQRRAGKCQHFGLCGGCNIQHITYEEQAKIKQIQVRDALTKIAKIESPKVMEIIKAEDEFEYRNKMDFAFSNSVWITSDFENKERRALGMHVNGRFDRVLNIKNCDLMPKIASDLVNFIRDFCLKRNATFWNAKDQKGVMRSLIIRLNSKGDPCVVLIFGEQPKVLQADLCMALKQEFQSLASLYWGVNKKEFESISETKLYGFIGEDFLIQNLLGMKFKVPVSGFAQVNTKMAEKLISKVLEVGEFKEGDVVYDLYSGIGTLSLHIAKNAKKVIGIEMAGISIESARQTAKEHELNNVRFFKGKVEDILTENFVLENEKPNAIVLDPPRNGIEKKVAEKLLEIGAERLIYVSCNPASFARDALILKEKYKLIKAIPLDMFPQTTHVEIIGLFEKL